MGKVVKIAVNRHAKRMNKNLQYKTTAAGKQKEYLDGYRM
jgi:hypothetical protein